MKSLIEIFKKMEPKAKMKTVGAIAAVLLLIIGTVTLIVADQQKAQKKQFAQYQQQIMQRLLQQQATQQKEQGYTEKDFNEAKKNLPPVEELDYEPK